MFLNRFKQFFYPATTEYPYDLPANELRKKFEQIFDRNSEIFDFNNLEGEFLNDETFTIKLKMAGINKGGLGLASLAGKISETEDGRSIVQLKDKPSDSNYLWFCFFILIGSVYLFLSVSNGSPGYLFWSLLMLTIGPVFCIQMVNLRLFALHENYIKYIESVLLKIENKDLNKD